MLYISIDLKNGQHKYDCDLSQEMYIKKQLLAFEALISTNITLAYDHSTS
jgi:hypothetical protein